MSKNTSTASRGGTPAEAAARFKVWTHRHNLRCELCSIREGDAMRAMSQLGQKRHRPTLRGTSGSPPIVLQKSKVAGLKIFRENTKQRAIADSYDLNRVTEV